MNVLVDHGSSYNLGDTAMLEAVVERLLRSSEAIEAHVIDHPSLKTRLWQHPRVTPVKFRLVRPLNTLGPFMRTPFLWRWSKAIAKSWASYCFASLGRTLRPGSIRIGETTGDVSLVDWCRAYDAYLVVGGGNLTDTFPGELWRRCCFIHAFAEQGKPVVLSGQQLGPFQSRIKRQALERALRNVDFVGLREPTESIALCQDAGLSPHCYAVMGDDSFGVAPDGKSRVESVLKRLGLNAGRFLAVNVRIASYSDISQAQLQEVARLVSMLSDRYGLPALVVPISLNEQDSDVLAGHRLAEATGNGTVQVLDEPDLTPGLIKGILGHAFGAVGVSYHFCTFALSQGVPAVCLQHGAYYGQKGRGLCRFWDSEDLAVQLGRTTTTEAVEQIARVFEDPGFREALGTRARRSIEAWESTFDSRILTALTASPERPRVSLARDEDTMGSSLMEGQKCS